MIKNHKIQNLVVLCGLFALACLPAACGVKPDMVDPPASVSTDTFPQTYPPADVKTHPPGRYLPDGYQPQAPQKEDTDDKGFFKP